MKLNQIMNTASFVIATVAPMVRVVAPGSETATKLADVLDTAQNLLKFGDRMLDEHLPKLAQEFEDIRAEVELLAQQGNGVPPDRWVENKVQIQDAVARVKNAMGVS